VPDPRRTPSLAATLVALGIAQIVSWGTLFYTIAVLGAAQRDAAGVSDVVLYGCYSAGLFLSGLVAPRVGRTIDARGGREVLAGGSLLAAIACTALACVQGPVTLALGWVLAGLAMAATLYDPAFATLHAVAGASYRRAVTVLTLFGGFASTVFWPLSQALLDAFGMRAAYGLYALLHLGLCLPLHLRYVPRQAAHAVLHVQEPQVAKARAGPTFAWLALALSIASFVGSALAAHLVGLLTAAGLTAREAVLIGALIGPMQVVGRLMELMAGALVTPLVAGTIAFATLALALAVFVLLDATFALAVLFVVLYGWSNGVLTIVRGTVPAELFGREGYGALLGRLAKPQFIARAVAPAVLAGMLMVDPGRHATLVAVAAAGVVAWLAYQRAVTRAAPD
jgi:hypothetical protein